MANYFQRLYSGFNKWANKQIDDYYAQQRLAKRDNFIAQTMREHDEIVDKINKTQGTTELQKEEMRLDALQKFYESPGEPEKGKDMQFEKLGMAAYKATGGFEQRSVDSNSLGSILGRVFNGRNNQRAVQQAQDNFNRFTSEYGFTQKEAHRLAEIRKERAAGNQAARDSITEKAAEALSVAKNNPKNMHNRFLAFGRAMYVDQKERYNSVTDKQRAEFNALPEEEIVKASINDKLTFGAERPPEELSEEWMKEIRGRYFYQRQMQAFMKTDNTPESEAYNLRAIKCFHDLDSNGKYKDQKLAVSILSEAVQQFRDYKVEEIDLTNPLSQSNMDHYPKIENMTGMGHALRDLVKLSGSCLTDESYREIFPTAEDRLDFTHRTEFIMCSANVMRSRLLRQVDYDTQYAMGPETTELDDAREKLIEKVENAYAPKATSKFGLGGKTNYEDFKVHYNEASKPQTDPRNRVTNDASVKAEPLPKENIRITELGKDHGINNRQTKAPTISSPEKKSAPPSLKNPSK